MDDKTRERIEDLEQEIAYASEEIHTKEAWIKQCEAEIAQLQALEDDELSDS